LTKWEKLTPPFQVRKANKNLKDTTKDKLLLNQVLLAWKHLLLDNNAVANYTMSSFIWIGIKAQLDPILYNSVGRNLILYQFSEVLFDPTLEPESIKSLWETAIRTYNETYPEWTPVDEEIIPRIITRFITPSTRQSYTAYTMSAHGYNEPDTDEGTPPTVVTHQNKIHQQQEPAVKEAEEEEPK
jgi:hypothetical protein